MNLFTLFLCSLCGSIIVSAVPNDDSDLIKEWNSFKTEFSRSYSSTEEKKRFEIFKENKRAIDRHNEKYRKGEESFEMGINQFGDLSNDELANRKCEEPEGYSKYYRQNIDLFEIPTNFTVPETLDWRKKGAVTPVKDQGNFLTCWAFSAIGALEGQNFIKNAKFIRLSEQMLIDCAGKYGLNCNKGGDKTLMFELVMEMGGVVSESSYPYTCGKQKQCKPITYRDKYCKVTGYKKIRKGDENALKIAVATIGPISVSFDMGSDNSFHRYKKGVFLGESCVSKGTNHAALLVGYGREDGKDYWLVKNSYGTKFGMDGYIKMLRNSNNKCNIASAASYPIVQPDY